MAFAAGAVLGLCLALVPEPAAAQQASLALRLGPVPQTQFLLPQRLELSGTWPDTCVPHLAGLTLHGADIDIQTRTAATACAPVPTPVQLELNPAASAGLLVLPAQVYRTRLYLQRGNGPSELAAFSLFDTTDPADALHPENGFWWSITAPDTGPASPGTGLGIERQGDHLAVTLLGYGTGGDPAWYFGTTTLSGRTAHVTLVRMSGGDPPFGNAGNAPQAQPGPVLDLDFQGPARALAWLSRPLGEDGRSIEVRPLTLARLPFETSRPGAAWRGHWLLSTGNAGTARAFDFDQLSTTAADSFRLGDAAAGATLECRLAGNGDQAVPVACTLSDGTGARTSFDRIGLDHLAGHTADGSVLELVRAPM